MTTRRDWAKKGLHRPSSDEDKPARKRRRKPGRSTLAHFLRNDRRRVRRALEPDYRDGERARRYGLSLADYRALQKRQGNACAICCKVTRVLCIDHCHVTGRVRGLLCRRCNSALGFYADDQRLLRAALAYLQATTRR
jgi:Recombination endonuclease VII